MTCSTDASKFTITVAQGGKFNVLFVVRDIEGALIDVGGALVWFTVRHRTRDVVALIVKLSLAAGGDTSQVEILNQVTHRGQFRVKLTNDDTRSMRYDASYVYDVFLSLSGGDGPYQLVPRSQFVVRPSVTRL